MTRDDAIISRVENSEEQGWVRRRTRLLETLMTTNQPLSRQVARLKGRKIEKILLNRFWDDLRREWHYNPTIYLDDGTEICFHVTETDTGEYGIEPIIRRAS